MKGHIKHLVIFFLFFSPAWAFSQTDSAKKQTDTNKKQIDSAKKHTDTAKKAADSTHYTDTTRYHFNITSTGTINHTNALSSYVFANSVGFSATRKRAALNFNNNWLYGLQDRSLTNNDFASTADLSLYKTLRHFYYWGLLTYQTSYSLQINSLFQGGLGAGYNVLDKKKAILILSDGILLERGDLYDILYGSPNGDVPQRDRYSVLRNSFRIKYHFVINDQLTLDGTEFIQNSLSNGNNYILKLSASASYRVYRSLSLTAAYIYNKFTRTRSENTLMTFGFTIAK